jgi:hypothetical protein
VLRHETVKNLRRASLAAGEFRRRAVKTPHLLKSAPVKSIRL